MIMRSNHSRKSARTAGFSREFVGAPTPLNALQFALHYCYRAITDRAGPPARPAAPGAGGAFSLGCIKGKF